MKTGLWIIACCFLMTATRAQVSFGYGYLSRGGFEKVPYELQETAPGMVLVEGFTESLNNYGKSPVKKTLSPFYISAYEETNGQYLAYLSWIKNCYSKATYEKALPDTSVWLKEALPDTLKERLMRTYFRSPGFRDYPVVGVSPEQVVNYARWKTDRANEMILIREGLLDFIYYPTDSSDTFSTEAYLSGNWKGDLSKKLPTFDEQNPERDVRMEDGIFLPRYRFPTSDELQWAADVSYFSKTKHHRKKPDNRSFDKTNYYGHLFVKAKKSKPLLHLRLSAVYQADDNTYRVKGLFGNVSEWGIDSANRYIAVGNCWKDDPRSYDIPYSSASSYTSYGSYRAYRTFMDSMKTKLLQNFYEAPEKRSSVSAAVGFRLAMDYTGAVMPATPKRRRWR